MAEGLNPVTEPLRTGCALQEHISEDSGRANAVPVSEDSPYPRLEPGVYDAECTSVGIHRDPRFHARKCRLEFSVLPDSERVFGFLHLGNGQKARAGCSSEYWRAWVIASGGQARKRQVLTPRVFMGKIFEVEISDVVRRFEGRDHPPGTAYSVIHQIVRRLHP